MGNDIGAYVLYIIIQNIGVFFLGKEPFFLLKLIIRYYMYCIYLTTFIHSNMLCSLNVSFGSGTPPWK